MARRWKPIEDLFQFIKRERPLSTSYVQELQAALTRHQNTVLIRNGLGNLVERPLLRGEYKQLPNNPVRRDGGIHEYCPPEHVAAEMDRLIELHPQHVDVLPEVEAAWLHHAFTQIHPFQGGNGRVARCLATIVFIKTGLLSLVVTRDERSSYITALETADAGDLEPLIAHLVTKQRQAILKASQTVPIKPASVGEAVVAARQGLERRGRIKSAYGSARRIAGELHRLAVDRLEALLRDLESEAGGISQEHRFTLKQASDSGARGTSDVAHLMRGLGANPQTFHAWLALRLKTEAVSAIVVSLHGIGQEDRGVIGGFIGLWDRDPGAATRLIPTYDETFQVNYLDDPADAKVRFERWLERGLTAALNRWRERL